MEETFLDELLNMPQVYGAQRSPDGRSIAVVMANVHDTIDVFLTDVHGSALQPLTQTDQNTFLFSWFADNTTLLVGHDHNGNERTQLFTVSIESPQHLTAVTERNPPYFLYDVSLHPSGHALVFAANYDLENHKQIEHTAILWHDLSSNQQETLTVTQQPSHSHISFNENATHILYSREDKAPGGIQYRLYTVASEEDEEILCFGNEAKLTASWLPDSRRIVFVTDTLNGHRQPYNSVGVYDIYSEEITWLIDGSQATTQPAFAFAPRYSHHIIIGEMIQGESTSRVVDSETFEQEPLPEHKGLIIPFAPLSSNKWLGMYDSETQPGVLAHFPLAADGTLQDIINPLERTNISEKMLTTTESITWQSTDGLEVHGWIFRPANNNGKTIVYIHGGPTSHIEREFDDEIQYYCHHGFTVFVPNYRGSTGYSNTFREAIKEDGWGGQEQQDILTGIDTLVERGLAIAGQIGVTGTSYGGYSSWFLITQATYAQVAAAAPVCGMTDLVLDYETTRPDLRPYSEEMLGGSPEQVPHLYYERSPIHYLEQITGSVLIVQGLQDPNVTPNNVEAVEERLEEANISYEKLVFDDEGHGIVKPSNKRVLYQRIADFFAETL